MIPVPGAIIEVAGPGIREAVSVVDFTRAAPHPFEMRTRPRPIDSSCGVGRRVVCTYWYNGAITVGDCARPAVFETDAEQNS